jgi:hypothetical protein
MTASAFEASSDDPNEPKQQLNNFRYVYPSRIHLLVGDVISFKGYFEVNSVTKGNKSQFTDKQLELHVVSEENDSPGLRLVQGHGSNRFGSFTLSGTFDSSTMTLEVRRVYATKQPTATATPGSSVTSTKKSSNKSTFNTTAPEPAVKISISSPPPSSPSSPTDVAQQTKGLHITDVSLAGDITHEQQPTVGGEVNTHGRDFAYYADARAVLKELKSRDTNKWFSAPVDAAALGLRDYHGVVKTPMDLGTVQIKLEGKQYSSLEECFADMRLTFVNALMYNPRGSPVYRAAADLSAFLEDRAKWLATTKAAAKALELTTTPAAIEASSIGKRNRVKKKFFEPGEDDDFVVTVVSKKPSSASAQQPPSTATSRASSSGRSLIPTTFHGASGNKKSTSKQQQSSKSRTTKRARPTTTITISTASLRKNSNASDFLSEVFANVSSSSALPEAQGDFGLPIDEDDEGVDSFDELDLQKTTEDMFMTPPPSDNEDNGDSDDDMPISAIPMAEGVYGRLANLPMSPTNITLDDL